VVVFLEGEYERSDCPADIALGIFDRIGQVRLLDDASVLTLAIVVEQKETPAPTQTPPEHLIVTDLNSEYAVTSAADARPSATMQCPVSVKPKRSSTHQRLPMVGVRI
jgi:hypothetical protein